MNKNILRRKKKPQKTKTSHACAWVSIFPGHSWSFPDYCSSICEQTSCSSEVDTTQWWRYNHTYFPSHRQPLAHIPMLNEAKAYIEVSLSTWRFVIIMEDLSISLQGLSNAESHWFQNISHSRNSSLHFSTHSQNHTLKLHYWDSYTYVYSSILTATFWLSPIFTFAPAFLPDAFPHLMTISRISIHPFLSIPILLLAQTSSIAGTECTIYFIKHTDQEESPLMAS